MPDDLLLTYSWDEPDLGWLQRELARYTYRPGWTLTIAQTGPPYTLSTYGLTTYALRAQFTAPDTYQPERTIQLSAIRQVDPMLMRDSETFARWLQHVLMDMECHESREWLRRDGVIYDNPHAKQGG